TAKDRQPTRSKIQCVFGMTQGGVRSPRRTVAISSEFFSLPPSAIGLHFGHIYIAISETIRRAAPGKISRFPVPTDSSGTFVVPCVDCFQLLGLVPIPVITLTIKNIFVFYFLKAYGSGISF